MTELDLTPKGHNKSAYYLLPLIGFNVKSFGLGNFYNSYLSYNGKIIVIVYDKDELPKYWENENYLTDFEVEVEKAVKATAIIYKHEPMFEDDVIKFIKGEYSQFSDIAKELIYKNSTLDYQLPIQGTSKITTHKMLMVLSKNPALKQFIEEACQVNLSSNAELLEPPNHIEEFMDIDTIVL